MAISKLERLRTLLFEKKIDALIVPSTDAHKSEYIAPHWKCREWISGFTGSAGTLVITQNDAGLWTDSRYFTQAENQLIPPFRLHKLKTRTPEYLDWVLIHLPTGSNLGIDARLVSWTEFNQYKEQLQTKNIELIALDDLFSSIWQDRPELPKSMVFKVNEKFNGSTRSEKIRLIQEYLTQTKTDYLLISALDEIAWLTNLRGNDILYNPVFYSYLLIGTKSSKLFIDRIKLTPEIINELIKDDIGIEPYETVSSFLQNQSQDTFIEIDSVTANYKLILSIPDNSHILAKPGKISSLKAIKNTKEIDHYRKAQISDGVAMCRFLHWLEKTIVERDISENEAAGKSEEFRKQQENYHDLSFEVISAYQENAALPHYTLNPDKPVYLKPEGLYLIDSGGQYYGGTTDITRTVALGPVSQEQKVDFTLVLKGHIRVANVKFPRGTRGFHIDTLARLDLWQHQKDFGHGTGHGIGYFLNVHEGPHGFAQSHTGPAQQIIEPGMVITNEPGIYHTGKYGIRIENVLVCEPDITYEAGEFLKFETITYCPIDRNLIDVKMLDETELEWINKYHQKVYELLSPKLTGEDLNWLKNKTSPLFKK